MKTATSISGGGSSAYSYVKYPTDYNLFSLVCLNQPTLTPKDKKAVQYANDKLEKSGFLNLYGEFVATAEEDEILYTIMDLEQLTGREIIWVRGKSFDQIIKDKQGYLPNKASRYCTTEMKLRPLFYWWLMNLNEPVKMNIGYRANEMHRVKKIMDKLTLPGSEIILESNQISMFNLEPKKKKTKKKQTYKGGFLTFEYPYCSNLYGKNRKKHKIVEWQKPAFPMVEDGIYKDNINKFFKDKPVRFANMNNCAGCFERNEILLKYQFINQPDKMCWFKEQEVKGTWKEGVTYSKIENHKLQSALTENDFSECDTGYCGL